MPVRSSQEYADGLRDGREVYYKGELVEDVTTHPATRGMIETQGELFDLQSDEDHADLLTWESPETGDPVSIFYKMPTTKEDLEQRRKATKLWMDYTCGVSGRANDFLANGVTGMAIGAEHFRKESHDHDFGQHVIDYYEFCRENDKCLTHALIDPQIDRSSETGASSFRLADDDADRPGVVRKVDEDEDGIVVSGARMLATLGPQADEILVYPFGYYGEDDEDEALAFAVPADADGVRQICRPKLSRNDERNNPLSSRFDEMDTFVVLDEVHVPWERVFVDGDVDICNGWRDKMKTAYAGLTYHQTCVKDLAKAEFAFGVALMLAESTGIDEYFHVQSKLGEISSMITQIRGSILAAEAEAYEFPGTDYLIPEPRHLFAVTSSFPDMYPRILQIIRDLGGSGLIGVPAWEDLEAENPLGGDVETYFRGKDIEARERLGIQKLAYELSVDGLGGREELYERFYTGGPMRVKSNMYKNHPDKEEIKERALEYGLAGADEPPAAESGTQSEAAADDD
jgi:4-hydroxyphenylacetate 3-monooxygenase oxygenase component